MAINITFNSYNLQDSNYITKKVTHRKFPSRIILSEPKSRRDGFNVVDKYYERKVIILEGIIVAATASALRTKIDDLKKNIRGTDKEFDIDYGGETIRYKATVQSIDIPEDFFHITFVPFVIELLCHPLGTATSTTNHSDDNIIASPHNSSLTITGSESPLPVITLTVDAETDMTVLKFKNTTTNTEIIITRAFSAADIIIIDCDNLTVKVNGTSVDFTGLFPEFDPGSNNYTITITDSGAFNVDLDVDYFQTFS